MLRARGKAKPGILKTMTMLTLTAAVAVSLTGCGKPDGNASATPNAQKPVTLKMMHNWTNPNVDNEIFKARIKQFQDENKNITIEVEEVPSNQYPTKLQTQATGRTLPDMAVFQPRAALRPYVEAGLLMPIDEILDNWKDILPKEALEAYSINGKHYAVPAKLTYADVIYYNKELLAQVGYKEFPKTYTEFVNMVKKLKAANITPIVVGNKDRWPLQSSFMSIITDRIAGTGYLEKAAAGEAKFTDPDFVKSLGVIEELTNLGAFNQDINTIDTVQEQNYFLQGKAAMSMTTSTIDAKYRQTNDNGANIGIALFPQVEGGKGNPQTSSGNYQFGLALNADLEKDKDKKAAAYKFLKFFYSNDLYKDLNAKGIIVPAKMELASSANNYMKEMVELNSKGTTTIIDQTLATSVNESLQNGLQAILTKQKTSAQIAEEIQSVQNKLKK
ncbi:ABC transporter substrate-binding protein [Paenibacillus planticolens]|uniref:Extracellular solute-binding protein n=1 Tax=Paenibacillus planticolens TaxID=2654976 RepID=A0ABX1ZF19_9BACL|nr:extracellular solute-binding protein [Paenibacillus planticolens]NOU98666.1 extracellular solute-binding protein [Paenibacillus planticolens]